MKRRTPYSNLPSPPPDNLSLNAVSQASSSTNSTKCYHNPYADLHWTKNLIHIYYGCAFPYTMCSSTVPHALHEHATKVDHNDLDAFDHALTTEDASASPETNKATADANYDETWDYTYTALVGICDQWPSFSPEQKQHMIH